MNTPTPDLDVEAALLEAVAADLAGVESVLERLDEGAWGACEVCAAELDVGSDPFAKRCSEHETDASV
jgi:RNA polymerase-binding transcription factor DksA